MLTEYGSYSSYFLYAKKKIYLLPKKLIVFDLSRLEDDNVISLSTISHYFVVSPKSPFRVFLVPACLNSLGVLRTSHLVL